MLKRWFALFLIALLPIFANAQNGTVYPIDLSVMMTPPYGTCLKEYVGSDRITIQALLKDFSKNSKQFVIQLKVTDNRNRVVLLTHFGDYEFKAGKTFTYPMGPNATQGDKSNVLQDLFNNASVKPKNECFEEGAYTFVFQAFEAASYPSRKIALSMPFTYPVFLQGNTVQPLQIYPYENEVICDHSYEYTVNSIKKIASQLGGIAYQWQSANPTGMRVGYHLQVVDLGDINNRTKEDIANSARGEFGKTTNFTVNTRTYTPFYNHTITEGNYVENHAYAWRVMAVTGSALEGTLSFTDQKAPVRVFYFCGAPGIEEDTFKLIIDDRKFDKDLHKVKMDTIKSTDLNAIALWRDSVIKDGYCGVNVEIRKKGQEKWTPYFVEKKNDYSATTEPTDNSYNFANLNYNTRYEVRAQYVKCDNCNDRATGCVYAPYSDPLEFMISSPIDSATCGDNLPKLTECGEGTKAPKILAGDTIIANGTKVVVDTVSYPNAQDSSIISGKGHICMPIVKNIQLKMEFDQIQINCAKELVKGKVKSIWDEKTCAMINIDELTGEGSTGGKDNASSDATVEEYSAEKAQSSPSGTLMVDKDGTVKFKTKDGKIEDIGKSISLSASEYQSKNYLADNSHYIEFFNEDKVNNAFDNDENGYYRKMSTYEYFDTPLNKVVLPWLANNPGKLKNIKAREVTRKGESAKFDSVMFVIPSGDKFIQLDAKKDNNGNYDLRIPGWADVDHSTPIFAIARNSATSSFWDAGKMMQANYEERTHKLIIVPTKEEYSADVAKIQEQLNAIYGRVGVTYTVEEDRSFTNDEIVAAILDDGLDIGADDESRWQVESGEMKLIRRTYEENHPDMDKKSAYLFLVNHAEVPYESAEGDMPRNQSVGYIFMNNKNKLEDGRVIAHEIGHGVYKFQHTFAYKDMESVKTDNLMDYNNGDFLAHYQWRVMQDSVMFVWKGLQNDEDGMFTTDGHYYLVKIMGILMGAGVDIAEKYGCYAETPDSECHQEINGSSVLSENDTWLRPKLQQRNHALTEGYHGAELAATTYAILHRGIDKFNMEDHFSWYLLHRFGDCFAHFDVGTGDSDFQDISLTYYVKAIDNFAKKHMKKCNVGEVFKIAVDGVEEELKIFQGQIIFFDNIFYTTLDSLQFKKEICKAILYSDNKIKTYHKRIKYLFPIPTSSVKYIDNSDHISNAVLGKLVCDCIGDMDKSMNVTVIGKTQNLYKMYGDPVTAKIDLTVGHAFDGTKPDEIARRPNLFKKYINRVAELYELLGYKKEEKDKAEAIETVNFVVDWLVKQVKNHHGQLLSVELIDEENVQYHYDVDYTRDRLDAVWAFLIAALKKETNTILPIKWVPQNKALYPGTFLYYGFWKEFVPPTSLLGLFVNRNSTFNKETGYEDAKKQWLVLKRFVEDSENAEFVNGKRGVKKVICTLNKKKHFDLTIEYK